MRDVIRELGLTNTRHDVVWPFCICMIRAGTTLPDAGLLTIEDAETGELLELDSKRRTVCASGLPHREMRSGWRNWIAR